MATNAPTTAGPVESPAEMYARQSQSDESPVPAADLLELLGDEYTQRILLTIIETPHTGREIVEQIDVSRPTVYRRLNALQDAGIVETEMQIDPDSHHCEQFRVVTDQLTIEFGSDGLSAKLDSKDSESRHGFALGATPADD